MGNDLILAFGAHGDDLEIGMGATIAKYSKEGKEVVGVIFSSGAKSSPWLKEDYLVKNRREEAKKIGEYVGAKETVFLDLKDGKLMDEIENPKVKKAIIKIIKYFKPKTIFVHSKFDPHQDHKAVNKVVFQALDEIDSERKISVYVYEVWNVLNDNRPRMYVDVTGTFHIKLEAMKKFKSQWLYVHMLMVPVIARAIFSGMHAKCKFAERFYKIR